MLDRRQALCLHRFEDFEWEAPSDGWGPSDVTGGTACWCPKCGLRCDVQERVDYEAMLRLDYRDAVRMGVRFYARHIGAPMSWLSWFAIAVWIGMVLGTTFLLGMALRP